MANSGIIAPPIIDIGIRIAQPAALVDCSFRPMAATSIMMPTKGRGRRHHGKEQRTERMHVHLEHERGEREHDRLKHHRSQEAPEPFAGENGRAGERGRLQAHQRAVRAFDHEARPRTT